MNLQFHPFQSAPGVNFIQAPPEGLAAEPKWGGAERIRLLAQLEEQRQRLNSMVSSVAGVVWEAWGSPEETTQRIDFVSEYVETMLGYTHADWLATPNFWLTIVHPDDQAAAAAAVAAQFAKGTGGVNRFRWVAKDGHIVWVESQTLVTRDEEGRAAGMRGVTLDITERRKAEEALEQKDMLIRLAGRLTHTGGWSVAMPGKTVFWSDEIFDIFEYAQGAAPSLGEALAFHLEPGRTQLTASLETCARDGIPFDLELEAETAKGRRIWVRACGEAKRQGTGEIECVQGAIQDISERMRGAEALRKSEGALALAQRVAHLGSWELDLHDLDDVNSNSLRWSDETFRIFGLEPRGDEMSNEAFFQIVHPADRERVAQSVAELLRTGTNYYVDHRIVLPAGGERLVREEARLIVDERSRLPVKIVGTVHDITDQQAMEEGLRAQAELLDLAPDAIMVRDLEDRIEFWNRGAEAIYGWTSAEAVGKVAAELFHSDSKTHAAAKSEVLRTGVWRGELRQVKKDGGLVIVNSCHTLVRDKQGAPKAILVLNTDLTEHKKLEAQFLRAQRLESVGALASGLAHDLNNTLSPILMCAPLLRSSLSPQQSESIISTIEKSSARAANIVKQVLTFSRGSEQERRLVPIQHLLTEMVEIAGATFPKTIRLEESHGAGLWDVTADATQLHQVLMNLCVNARDAMPGGGLLRLTARNIEIDEHYASMMRDARPGCYVLIEATDTGAGIPAALLDKIFEPFFTTKAEGKGTGLGLASVAGIVKSHGGFISVQSEAGRGTTFKIFLPAGLGTPSVDVVPLDPPPIGAGECILIVDDEESVCAMGAIVLETHGYTVLTTSEAADAVAVYAQNKDRVAAVLTDLSMPFMDGVALVRALRKINPQVKLIVSTGQEEQGRLAELKSLNVSAYLSKPYAARTMLTTLSSVLSQGAE